GALEAHLGDAVVLATGGYASAFHQSTNAQSSNATAIVRAYEQGAAFANPCFVQFHPTCLPPHSPEQGKLILMSEALRNDGRVWVPRARQDRRAPESIPEAERDYYLERLYPRYGNLAPRDLASRAAKARCDAGQGVGPDGRGVYLDLAEALAREGEARLVERYANLFELYERATGSHPLRAPMIIYPAAHYSMGGLWVDYDLMSNLPGLFVIGEANFSDHGANRLGASALLQGLADGYFVLPLTLSGYLGGSRLEPCTDTAPSVRAALARAEARTRRLLAVGGRCTPREFHAELGRLLWQGCGLSRQRSGLERCASALVELRERFWRDVRVVAGSGELNQELERAGRVADFLQIGELRCLDALAREESGGCHFREEWQTPEGEAQRRDAEFAHVAVWFHGGEREQPRRQIEPLRFRHATPTERSYR
ncbi:MAG TPA: succinate dehydrogenase (quinone) flavoprotein subunit, partial [Polyangiaceae bacterium]|nr:succinate dehydrogenase (quinone) flavoprotein subunit [Polyangiaceae bacterium]